MKSGEPRQGGAKDEELNQHMRTCPPKVTGGSPKEEKGVNELTSDSTAMCDEGGATINQEAGRKISIFIICVGPPSD